jgi:hypothetical protein
MNRTPSIVLHFDPKTEFGRRVRIVVPWGQYDQIERTLCGIVGQDTASASRRAARAVEQVLSESILGSEESQRLSRLSSLARDASLSVAEVDRDPTRRREEKTPNKAPEPTPGAVTPRATEGDSK